MANKRVTDLADFRAQMLEQSGGLGIEFELSGSDGQPEVFLVPHPMAATDEQDAAIESIEEGSGYSQKIARVLLNTPDDDGKYDRFVAAGGRTKDILMAWRGMQDLMQRNGFALPK